MCQNARKYWITFFSKSWNKKNIKDDKDIGYDKYVRKR
jgi:hypothetical protein